METNKLSSATAQIAQWKSQGIDFLYNKGPNLLGAVLIVVLGFFAARLVCRLLLRWLEKIQLEPPVRMLLTRVTWILIMALFILVAMGTMGIAVGPLIALMSVAGVGVGLATQGVLANLVSGLLIIFTKPFRVGEYIEVVGNYGQVTAIELFSTTLIHPDRSRVVIPNRKVSGEILHNYGTIRQHDISVGVAYNTNLPQAIAIIQNVLAANQKILKDPAPAVAIKDFGDFAITIAIQPWSNLSDFGATAAELKLAIVEAFRANRIDIPFPQREVRVVNATQAVAS
jgi:small conductance mechanosensitive channel